LLNIIPKRPKDDSTNEIEAFSLAETIILIVILAIAVAASTPIITRKIAHINHEGIGAALGGATHGRYEAYVRELLNFGGTYYEKVANPSGPIIYAYEKKGNSYEEIPNDTIKSFTPEKDAKGEEQHDL